ncbi:translation protein SH3-like domain-containing protein [Suillus placidus]|uniref:Large ribosomal subunit protein uL2m n=1 Tax=Suillus placidus TaxID=48579 RepID=A0A9P7D7R2_9AGAM|nr:translation protein SH3-like domain-containing protein [Suillus placidus]
MLCVRALRTVSSLGTPSSFRALTHVFRTTTATNSIARTYATHFAPASKDEPKATSLDVDNNVFKTYKPVSPGIRHLRRPINDHIYQGKPVRLLTACLRKHGGRNSHGRITVRFRGGGHKRRVRLIDFVRTEPGEYDVIRIEYDPGRSAHIALIKARDANVEGKAKWKYILATEGMRPGDVVQSYRMGMPETTGILRARTVRPGNVLPIRFIPTGTVIHCVALSPTGKALLVRSAGSFAQVVHHDESGRYSHVRLQSGEIRKVLQDCCATIGRVSNLNWKGRKIGKAGRNRWLGWRPRVRGVAMNAKDHPHGGGRGKSKSNKHPVSVWGWATKGKRTRKPGPRGPKNSNKMVIRERPRGKEKRAGGS